MKRQIKTIAEALLIIKELQAVCKRQRKQIENLTKEVEASKAFNQFLEKVTKGGKNDK